MDKQAIDVDPATVARFATGGVLTGAGGAALLSLARMVRDMRKQQLAQREDETDENTIVLTLPRKTAEVTTDKPTTAKVAPCITRSTFSGPGRQIRHMSGEFGSATKYSTAWPSLTLGVLAGITGTAAGAHVVNRIYQKHREQKLQDELSQAQQEYLDALQGSKVATVVDQLFPALALEKEADVFGMLNLPVALAAILSTLGAAGTGYVTKRVLDEKLRDASSRGLDIPKVQRIVFKSAPAPADARMEDEEEKEASAEDLMCIKAAVCVMCDALDTEPRILNTDYVKEACDKAGMSKHELLKSAQDVNELINKLQLSPDVQLKIVRAGMETHPILKHFKWAANIPGIRNLLYKQTTNRIGDYLQGAFKPKSNPSKAGIFARSLYSDLVGSKPKQAMPPKEANFGLMASLVGSTIAERNATDDVAKAVVRAQEMAKNKANAPSTDRAPIAVEGADPEALAYVDANREQIAALIAQLMKQGKL